MDRIPNSNIVTAWMTSAVSWELHTRHTTVSAQLASSRPPNGRGPKRKKKTAGKVLQPYVQRKPARLQF
ncbi:MAG: hypothetical protein RL094_124, partial [Candidatus Parcubacteria bacterium]